MVVVFVSFRFTLHNPHHSASNFGSQRGVPIPTSFHTTAISQSGDIATAKLVIFIKMMEMTFCNQKGSVSWTTKPGPEKSSSQKSSLQESSSQNRVSKIRVLKNRAPKNRASKNRASKRVCVENDTTISNVHPSIFF